MLLHAANVCRQFENRLYVAMSTFPAKTVLPPEQDEVFRPFM